MRFQYHQRFNGPLKVTVLMQKSLYNAKPNQPNDIAVLLIHPWFSGGGVRFCFLQQPGLLGGSVAVLETVADLGGRAGSWQACWLIGWTGRVSQSWEGAPCCCQCVCVHIMLFCSEFTSEFSSPRTLWWSGLGVRELWMFRESSSFGGAFTGSSSLFWE